MSISMEGVHRLLFKASENSEERKETDKQLLALRKSFEVFERAHNRPVDYTELGRVYPPNVKGRRTINFDMTTCSYFWRRACQAWKDGWLLQPLRDDCAKTTPIKPEPFRADLSKIKSIPEHEVQTLEGGRYKWRGFEAQASSFKEGYTKLNTLWIEKQSRDQDVKDLGRRRLAERVQAVNLDDEHRISALEQLKHPNYKQVFVGRFFDHGTKATFEEEGTWISVCVDAPSESGRCAHGTGQEIVRCVACCKQQEEKQG